MFATLQLFLKRIGQKIDRFFFKPVRLRHLAFFRICIALFCILQLVLVYPDLLNIFGEHGYLSRELSEVMLPAFQPRISWVTDFLDHRFGIDERVGIYWLSYFFLFCLLCLLVGFLTRLMSLLCFLIFSMYFGTGNFIIFGADCFALLSLFYCLLLPVGKAFSIDNLLFSRVDRPSFIGTFFIRLLQFHLCLVYLFAGLSKAVGVAWWQGEGIWRSTMNLYFKQFDLSWLADFPEVAALLSVLVVLLETFYPVFMFVKKIRPFWLLATLALHLGIGIVMGLHLFAFIMIFWNITAFGWEYVEALLQRLRIGPVRTFKFSPSNATSQTS